MRKRVNEQGSTPAESHSSAGVGAERNEESGQSRSRCWVWTKRGVVAFCIVYVTVPFLVRLSPGILKFLVYAHTVKVPFFTDLSRPADLSLNHTLNLYLTPEEGITVGVWHTVPDSSWKEAQGKDLEWYQRSLGDGAPIFIYFHGNAGTRGMTHRVGLVKVLSALGFHVLSIDYRGFADSTGVPTEAGLTTDALYLHQWMKTYSGDSRVFIWGHSLGTGVATNTALRLQEQGTPVDAVVLEGAFTNCRVAGANHPFAWFYWKFPWFEYFFLDPLKDNDVVFPNDENLRKMRTPLLILHAEDDHIVPFRMGQELYNIAVEVVQNAEERVKMVPFSGSHGYLHNGLYKDPYLPNIIRQFVESLTL